LIVNVSVIGPGELELNVSENVEPPTQAAGQVNV
jgi:hypothetical protein